MINLDSLFKPGLQVFEYDLSEEEIAECDKIKAIIEKEALWIYSRASVVFEIRNEDEKAYIAGGEKRNCIIAVKAEEGNGFDYFAFAQQNEAFYVVDFKNDMLDTEYPDCDKENAKAVFNAFVHYLLDGAIKSTSANSNVEYAYVNGECVRIEKGSDRAVPIC